MATKTHDIVAKTGEYEDQNGEMKARWQNVGSMMEGDNGPFILLDRTFSPAGLANPQNRSNCILSLFSANRQQSQTEGTAHHQGAPAQQQQPAQQNQQPMSDKDQGFPNFDDIDY